eukprot:PhM_4_TR8562/c0_g1_i1/m.94822/K21848/ARV1; lipid intermediate transporter
MVVCVECHQIVPHLHEADGPNVQLSGCPHCGVLVADPYIEYDTPLVLLDVALLRSRAWCHLTMNRFGGDLARKVIVPWVFTAFVVNVYLNLVVSASSDVTDKRLGSLLRSPDPAYAQRGRLEDSVKASLLAYGAETTFLFLVLRMFASSSAAQRTWRQQLEGVLVSFIARLPAAANMVWVFPERSQVLLDIFFVLMASLSVRVGASSWPAGIVAFVGMSFLVPYLEYH